MTNQPSVAEQIAANEQAEQGRTQRASRLAALAPEDMKIVLDSEEFEGQPTTDDEDQLLEQLLEQHVEATQGDCTKEELEAAAEEFLAKNATKEELEAAAEEALKPELESLAEGLAQAPTETGGCDTKDFDPALDNPMQPKSGPEKELTEEEKKELIEKQKKANRDTLKNNRRAAKEWIGKKKGIGVLLGRDQDGSLHTLVLGDEDSVSNVEITIDNPMFQLLLTLVLSHLPGASVNSQVMHAQQMEGLNNVANHLMAGLQATNNNVLQLVAFLKLKFPELQADLTPMQQTKSGILMPSKG